MNLQKTLTKKISFLLIISILSLNLSFLTVPKKADALFGVGDLTFSFDAANFGEMLYEFGKKVAEVTLAATAHALARQLIIKTSEATVDWINSGFNGNPAYVADIGKFLTGPGGITDSVIGNFFANSSLGFMCDPFRIQVLLALQLDTSFKKQIGCTIRGIANNVDNALLNSNVVINISTSSNTSISNSNVSVWDSWLRTTLQPQNNPIGSYLIAKNELDTQIGNAKVSATLGLTMGQGALSYTRCVDTYYDANGKQIDKPSEEYTGSYGPRPKAPNGTVRTDPSCKVKTPGTTITTMLGFRATSDPRMAELTATLSDGIDQVFNALVGALVNKALAELKNGLLGDNSSSNKALDTAITAGWTNSMNTANSDVSHIQQIADTYSSSSLPTYTIPTLPNISTPDVYNPTTPTIWDWYSTSSASIPAGTNIGTNTNVGYGYDVLGRAKTNSIALINSLAKAESAYQNVYLIEQNLLTQAKNVFASSSVCNMNYNKNDSILRSLLIRSNVITNIDGMPDSNRTIASIPWNLKIINSALGNSNANMTVLNKAVSGVNGAGDMTAITDAMISVNSTSFNTSADPKMIDNIKTWLRGVQGMYNSSLCPINLTKVLQITSATSTVK